MNFLGKEISGKFTIPSGIVTTNPKVIEKLAKEIPELGVITTKSIRPTPKIGNKEPIFHQYAPGCFINAVGLTSPGAEEFAKQLEEINFPKDKFLLISIFGKNAEEFVEAAKTLEKYADGFELNFSCPHDKGHGMAIGQDPNVVKEITAAVKQVVNVPLIPKLTPNTSDIGAIAKAAVEGGASAICAINTIGPGFYSVDGNPVLTNKIGGISGLGTLPIGLKCVKEIKEAVDVPIIGCGGISCVQDVIDYELVGSSIIGIGSALIGMNSEELKNYFKVINEDLKNKTNNASNLLKKVDMCFKKYKLVKNKKLSDDLSILIFDKKIDIKSGQFVFVWIPGVGEKPFSVLDNDPLTLSIQKVGCFTEKAIELKEGDEVYFRGPYGKPIKKQNKEIVLVGGGVGFAALFQIAKENNNSKIFIGAKDKQHLYYLDKLNADVFVSTNDGSEGHHGFVTELLEKNLEQGKDYVFYNCGPEPMIKATIEIEKKYTNEKNIFNSIDYVTKCGVGICGSCATSDGKRACVDGPFIGE